MELAERGRATIERYLGRAVEKERLTGDERDAALARLTLTTNVADLADCDLVIEAIVEELEPKRELFAELDRDHAAGRRPRDEHVRALGLRDRRGDERPERVVGMHFFNPAPVLPLVEIVRARSSSDAAVDTAYDWAEQAGKRPVSCNDTPGFIVNRILIPLLNDCVRVLDEADVTPEDLDTAMTNGAGWPLGPCALVDLVGIDVHVHASEALHAQLGEARMAPPERLVQMQRDGIARPQVGPAASTRTDRRAAAARPCASARARATRRAGCVDPLHDDRERDDDEDDAVEPLRVLHAGEDRERGEEDRHRALEPAPHHEEAFPDAQARR